MKIKIPFFAYELIRTLREKGYLAYAVGGAVRDCLLHINPTDWDVTTSASPYEVMEIFKDKKVIPTGIRQGTVTVINKGRQVEITTMRGESNYKDCRRPGKVRFIKSLDEDLKRRDFTMNALCIGENGEVIDKIGGIRDLKAGMIKTVGNPEERFKEDALRILRAVRLASVYGFTIEEKTKKAIFNNAGLIKKLSPERIMKEVMQLLKGKNVRAVLMEYKEVIFNAIPALRAEDGVFQRQDFHVYDVWEHSVVALSNIENEDYLRLTMLLHDVGKPPCADGYGHFKGHAYVGAAMCEDILKDLHVPTKLKNRVIRLVRLHNMVAENTDENIKKMILRYGSETVADLIKIFRADSSGKRQNIAEERCRYYTEMEERFQRILKEQPILSQKDLKINGRDIMAMGVPKGPLIGKILKRVTIEACENNIPNERKSLLALAEKIKSSAF